MSGTETVNNTIPRLDFENIVDAVQAAVKKGDSGVRLAGAGINGQSLHDSVSSAIEDVLSISMADALLQGWSEAKVLHKLTGKNAPMDGKPRKAALGQHKVNVTYKPEIHFNLGGKVNLKRLTLPVSLKFSLAGAALTVVDRKVTKAKLGTVSPLLLVKLEDIKIVEAKLPTFEILDDFLAQSNVNQVSKKALVAPKK